MWPKHVAVQKLSFVQQLEERPVHKLSFVVAIVRTSNPVHDTEFGKVTRAEIGRLDTPDDKQFTATPGSSSGFPIKV